MNKRFALIVFYLALGLPILSFSQSTDLARIEYTYFPQSDSDNSFRRFKSFVNLPLKLNDKGAYLVPGVEYENVNLKFNDITGFRRSELDRYQSFTASLGYTYKMNELWRFGATVGGQVASNFELNKVIADDVIFTGSVFFIKIKEDERYIEPWRLILGLSYTTTSGIPFPLPIINYYKRFHPNWSYTAGVPKSNIRYFINEKSVVQGFLTLDGFFSNIQNNFTVGNQLAESFSMTIVLAGLGYEYNFTDNLSLYVYGGHTVWNDIRLRDGNRENVYTINSKNTFYGRGGLKFSIL